jgi:hypothetical protein
VEHFPPRSAEEGKTVRAPHRRLVLAAALALVALVVGPVRGDAAKPAEQPVTDPVTAPAEGWQSTPAVASGTSSSLVVWQDSRSADHSDDDIVGARVDGHGKVLDVGGIPIGTDPSGDLQPAVASNGTDYLVVWQEDSPTKVDLYGRRVHESGQPVGPIFPISAGIGQQTDAAVASDGSGWLVTWTDTRGASRPDIYGARVDAGGNVLDPSGIRIGGAPGEQVSSSVAYDGQQYLVAWADTRPDTVLHVDYAIYAARITTAGQRLDGSGFAVTTMQGRNTSPSVASSGSNTLVTWGGPDDIVHGARVSHAGVVLDPSGRRLSQSSQAGAPSITWDGTSYLVSFFALTGPDSSLPSVAARRVGPGGGALGTDVLLSTSPNLTPPAAATTSTGFLVVWGDRSTGDPDTTETDVLARRVGPAGGLQGTTFPVSIGATQQTAPDLAFDGTDHLVVWTERSVGGDVMAARIGPDGVSLDPNGIVVAAGDGTQSAPAVAFDGARYLVVWSAPSPHAHRMYAARVSTAGVVLDPDGILLSSDLATGAPDVAVVGGNFMAIWQDARTDAPGLYESRVDGSGTVLGDGPERISADGCGCGRAAHIASGGDQALVVWEQYPNEEANIGGERLSATGAVLDSPSLTFSAGPNDELTPQVAFDGTRYLVVWRDGRSTGPGIYGTRVGSDGSILDPDGIAIAARPGTQDQPAVAANGPFEVTWRDRADDPPSTTDVDATTVDGATGEPSSKVAVVGGPGEDDAEPAVAPAAGNGVFRVAWQHFTAEQPYGATRVYTRSVGPK